MALSPNINNREMDKFFADPDNNDLTTVRTSARGEMRITGLRTGGQITKITLNSTEWTPLHRTASTLPTGDGPLDDRNHISIQNQSSNTLVMYQFVDTASVTYGVVIPYNYGRENMDIKDNILVYGRTISGTADIVVAELA